MIKSEGSKNDTIGSKYLDLTCEVLKLLNDDIAIPDMVESIIETIRSYTGFDAIGLRLKSGDDYPFYCHEGFSEEFIKKENSLHEFDSQSMTITDLAGNPRLVCTCGLVASGYIGSGENFSDNGSFFVEDSLEFITNNKESDSRAYPRNRCLHEGYRSIALIPLRSDSDVVGLLLLNAKEPKRINKNTIVFFESLANSIGVALNLKRSQETLKKSDEAYKSLVEGLPDVVIRLSSNQKVLFSSENILQYSEVTKSDIIGCNFSCVDFVSSAQSEFDALLSKAIQAKSLVQSEIVTRTLKGKTVFNVRVVPELGLGGRVGSLLLVLQDVSVLSVQKELAEKLNERNNLLCRAMDYSPTGIVIAGAPDGRILYSNDAVYRLINKASGKSLSDITIDDYESVWVVYDRDGNTLRTDDFPLVRALMYGESVEKQLILRGNEGQDRIVNSCSAPIRNSNGDIIAGIVVIPDITVAVKTQSKLLEAQNKFSKLFHASPDTIILSRFSDGFVLDVNNKCEDTFGFKRDEFVGKTTGDLGIWKNKEARESVLLPISFGEKVCDVAVKLKRKSGEEFDAIVYAEGICLDGKDCIVSSFRDVTERVLINEKLKQADKMSAIGQLVGGIAHDFNNQLTGILGYSDYLASNIKDAELKRYAENIAICAEQSSELVEKLRVFSRKKSFNPETLSIHNLINEINKVFAPSTNGSIRIVTKLEAVNPFILGDVSQLQNTLLNLAINAKEAISGVGEISFCTKNIELDEVYCSRYSSDIRPGNYIAISVVDNGCGIEKEVISKVFDPFFTTKAEGKGIGMGLATVYGAIKQHRGAVEVVSDIGIGTTVTLYIPEKAVIDKEADSNQGAGEIVDSISTKGHVLLVDDEEVVRTLGEYILTGQGYSVTTCSNGVQAVAEFENISSDIGIVVLDMIMPEMDGREAFLKMNEINSTVPVVITSGYFDRENISEVLSLGVREAIKKPYKMEELLSIVGRHINGN